MADQLAFGALFARHAEALVGSEESPADPGYVARLCYLAGFVYLGFVVFCGLQVSQLSLFDTAIANWCRRSCTTDIPEGYNCDEEGGQEAGTLDLILGTWSITLHCIINPCTPCASLIVGAFHSPALVVALTIGDRRPIYMTPNALSVVVFRIIASATNNHDVQD